MLVAGLPACGQSADGPRGFDQFRRFEAIYEPSGVEQLPDGRFVVVQDEAAHPLDLFSLQEDGRVSEQPLYRSSMLSWASPNRALGVLKDLEGVAIDGTGLIYAITSHSRKENGKRDPGRELLARFRLEGEQIADFHVARSLLETIIERHQSLKESTQVRATEKENGFNIEGLCFDESGTRLLLGLRAPVLESDAVILILENPSGLFERGEDPLIADHMIRLDLDGGGIRALAHDPHLGGYLIVSRKPGKSFKLWLWAGDPETPARRVRVAEVKKLRRAEGVTPVRWNGKPAGILIVSDEGKARKGDPGRYLFLRYDQLVID